LSRKARKPARLRLAAAAAAALPVLAGAGSLELVPQVEVGGVYETNPRFLQDCKAGIPPGSCGNQYAMGNYIDAQLRGTWRTADSEFSLTPRVRDWNYLESNKDLNNNDVYLDGVASRRFQRLQTALLGLYSDTLIRQQILEDPTPTDPNGPPPSIGGSGQSVTSGATQSRWLLRPTLAYQVSTRNELSVQYEYSEVAFDDAAPTFFFDFDAQNVNLALTHTLNPRMAFRAGVYGSTFDASNADRAPAIQRFSNSTDTYGVNAAYEFAYSERLSFTADLGTARNAVTVTTPLQGTLNSSDTTLIGNLGLRQRSERSTINVDVGRSQIPRSDGRQITQDQARIFVERTLTPRTKGSVAVSAFDQSGIGDADRFDQTLYAVDFNASYRLERDWTVQATYRYQTINEEAQSFLDVGQGGTAFSADRTNRRIFVSVVYRGIGIRR
jgi:hypothetical protein